MFERLKKGRGFGILISVAIPFLVVGIMMTQCDQNSAGLNLPDKVDFNYDVKPILVQNCYLCHGPDPSSRKADLRLDIYEGATAFHEDRQAIHPGKAGKSELIRRITNEDNEKVMPPPESNLVLSEYEIAILKKWIDQGAEWKPHWSFIQPEYSEPKKFNEEQSSNVIDDFVLEKMERKGLKPAPLADMGTLVRRVSYILTGLPPTLDEIQMFTNDTAPEAYEKMVDHYLDSPAFGERWARHWMDVVRYAETHGHEFDYEIPGAWRYRDYLIRAFNNDVPYDQFIREHIAGDMTEPVRWNAEDGTNESQIGTVFFTLGEGKHSPVDIKEEETDRIDNMIDVTSKAFQALTVSCAKCHDHKFDPIPTADYYALYGVMESSRFTLKSADVTYEKLQDFEKLNQLKKDLKSMVANNLKDVSDYPKMETSTTDEIADIKLLGDFRGNDLDGWISDGLAFGNATTLGQLIIDKKSGKIQGVEDGKASSKLLAKNIFGVLRSPNFTITKDKIGVKAIGKSSTVRIIIDNFQLIRNPIYGGLTKNVNKAEWQDVVFDLSAWKGHKAYLEIFPGSYINNNLADYQLPEDAFIELKYVIAFDDEWPAEIPNKTDNSVDTKNIVDRWLANQLNPAEAEYLNSQIGGREISPEFNEKFEEYQNLAVGVKDSSFLMGMTEGFGVNSHVFVRGNHLTLSDEEVPRGFLSVLSSDNSHAVKRGSGRLELVEAMLDKKNPLTSRVMVNRIWHYLFGKGIVETVDNFGLQGKLPTHPELLDYLAIRFRDEEWSMKKMIKLIVMSNTFRREVVGPEDLKSDDPDNLYLSHFPVRRLEAEAIRDGLLFAGGNLDLTMYGPPKKVYLTEFMTGRGRPSESGTIDGDGRRTIYLGVRRNFLQPMMLAFDRPIPFTTFGNRNVTNVPAQSLILMNDPFVKHQAELMAKLVIEEKDKDVNEKVNLIYLRTMSRLPDQTELDNANEFIRQLALTYELKPEEINDSLEVWKDFCHSVFNLKEFIYLI
ncbi:MAG: PSD1 and planctomycete cytochrome C domain-containing protein [Bacteroidota bacterium]